jgi:hypothetical protein
MLNVIMLSVVRLNVIMLSVVRLNVFMLSVVAPGGALYIRARPRLMGWILATPTNVRLGQKCLPWINVLAYFT